MGAQFEIRHANIMLYLTLPEAATPRLSRNDLRDFLWACVEGNHGTPAFFSRDDEWPDRVRRAAERGLKRLDSAGENVADSELIGSALLNLEFELRGFPFFAFVFGNENPQDEITAIARRFAYESGGRALVMIPFPSSESFSTIISDPFDAVIPAIERRDQWPGMLFWTRDGESAFVPRKYCHAMCDFIARASEESIAVGLTEHFDRMVRQGWVVPSSDSSRLLHLSDLHFGRPEAIRYQSLLRASIEQELDGVDNVVISGDLFDNPKPADFQLFKNFRNDLHLRTGVEPIVVPGNHDQRWMGNIPGGLRQAADLDWSNVVVDDESQTLFVCFDSARNGAFARGRVDKQQRIDIGTALEARLAAKPQLKNYLRVGVVHHHPFTFDTARETWVQKFLGAIGLSDETFLKMEEADEFVEWLLRRRIPVVLHGHKHQQRHVEHSEYIDKEARRLTSVGCGTSLGAEGYPLTYNVLTWDSGTQSWSVSFFADPGDGSGFTRQRIVAHKLVAAA